MLAFFAAVTLLSYAAQDAKVVELVPSDDIWVYPHASDPGSDAYLRVWGVDGRSVAGPTDVVDEFSYSILKWSTKDPPKDAKLVEAKLILTHTPNPAFAADVAKQTPIEVRPLPSASFTEKTWQHGDISKLAPAAGPKGLFGSGYPQKVADNKEIIVEIDLLKGPNDFKAYLAESLKKGELSLALTSGIDASTRAVYKLYSKDGPKEHRPRLKLKFE